MIWDNLLGPGYGRPVRIQATGDTIRDLLTRYVPLSERGRLLWYASQFNRGATVGWDVFSPWVGAGAAWLPSQKHIDFSAGELAYVDDSDSESNRAVAQSFVVKSMTSGASQFQVRWAMFFLGRYKVKAPIPTLIKDLTYEYAPSPVDAERYPASEALIRMGQAASDAAIAELQNETLPLRVRLLCNIVVGVLGVKKGRTAELQVEAAVPIGPRRAAIERDFAQAVVLAPESRPTALYRKD